MSEDKSSPKVSWGSLPSGVTPDEIAVMVESAVPVDNLGILLAANAATNGINNLQTANGNGPVPSRKEIGVGLT